MMKEQRKKSERQKRKSRAGKFSTRTELTESFEIQPQNHEHEKLLHWLQTVNFMKERFVKWNYWDTVKSILSVPPKACRLRFLHSR